MTIIQIPGFNSGPGSKTEQLKKSFPQADIYCPNHGTSPVDFINHIQEHYISLRKDIHIVGTSLGGFYTMMLSLNNKERNDIYYYAINPLTNPYDRFKDKIGQVFENHKTKDKFIISEDFINQLKGLQHTFKTQFEYLPCMSFYFGKNDDVIDHSKLKEYLYSLGMPMNIFESDQDHQHQGISRVIQQIKENNL
jgi:predicted esterase YcpF (UPF0227 family)